MKKRAIAAALLAIVLIVPGCGTKTPAQGDAREIGVAVIHGDGSTKAFEIETQCENLGDALVEQNLAQGEQGAYGLYIKTADGETVDDTKEQWWCITKDGEPLSTGASQTPIADGDTFELTFTTGYTG